MKSLGLEPIVMLHGYSPDHRLMKGCMEPVFVEREGWKRIYIDLPGMGKTTDYETINNSDEMLVAVVELIHSLIPNERYLCGGILWWIFSTRDSEGIS